MIFTARQLEDLHRTSGSNGQIVLPYRARLTPLANDFIRSRKIQVGYSDAGFQQPTQPTANAHCACPHTEPGTPPPASSSASALGNFLWWTDGPSGAAKAAVTAQAKESVLTPLPVANDAKQLIPAIKALAQDVKSGRALAGILLVQHGPQATVFANRCPSLRAILGTSIEAVDQGVRTVAANALIVEYPRLTFPQIRNLLSRFVRGSRTLSPDTERQLQELNACG
jgi:hypothetical protein